MQIISFPGAKTDDERDTVKAMRKVLTQGGIQESEVNALAAAMYRDWSEFKRLLNENPITLPLVRLDALSEVRDGIAAVLFRAWLAQRACSELRRRGLLTP